MATETIVDRAIRAAERGDREAFNRAWDRMTSAQRSETEGAARAKQIRERMDRKTP